MTLHQEGRSGRPPPTWPRAFPGQFCRLPNAVESPTVGLAKRECSPGDCCNWNRRPCELRPLQRPAHIGVDGSHLASTLFHLARRETGNGDAPDREASSTFELQIRSRPWSRIFMRSMWMRTGRGNCLRSSIMDRERNLHAARALSDGTLRFLALAILERDPDAQGLLCSRSPKMEFTLADLVDAEVVEGSVG